VRFDAAVEMRARVGQRGTCEPLWSDVCGWVDLTAAVTELGEGRCALALDAGWACRWAVMCRFGGGDVVVPVREVGSLPDVGREPVRRFSWHRSGRHRSGLEYLVSTGRHHGYESLEEARLLLMLDFAGGIIDVLSQPFRLRFIAEDGPREHIPDFFARTRSGAWLIDVRPAGRIQPRDEVAFAAAAEVALLAGWGYVVVTGWLAQVFSTVDTFSAQRRPLTDLLGLGDTLLAAVTAGPRPFGELAAGTVAPAIARAYLLHLLWHRRLRMNLRDPLMDHTLIAAAAGTSGGTR
jgi:hypothetical protein